MTSPSMSSTRGIFQETRKGQFESELPLFHALMRALCLKARVGRLAGFCRWDGHLSRTRVATRLKHATRAHGRAPYRVPICACSRWGLPSHAVADALVRFYRTVSAFPSRRGSLLFCGTNPSGHPAQPLAGILPFGARTFLTPCGARPSGPLAYNSVPRACSK